jgi:AraC-like DNA-binding protein
VDVLSDLLRGLHLRSVLLSIAELRAPWGFHKDAVDSSPFHVILDGKAVLSAATGQLKLQAGDMVLLARGNTHALASDPSAKTTTFSEVLRLNALPNILPESGNLQRIRFGGTGVPTRIATGLFVFDDPRRHVLLEALPNVIRLSSSAQQVALAPDRLLKALIVELRSDRPGSKAVGERLAEILFINAVRSALDDSATAFLRGLNDPQVGRALTRIHANLGAPWGLDLLAKEVGLSRTVLATRFRAFVGTSVMAYISSLRMNRAKDLLRARDQSIASIADSLGYESEVAFRKAFRRINGEPPGRFRNGRDKK